MEILEVAAHFWKNLERGIQFENTDLLLPWNETLSNLKDYGKPYVSDSTDKTTIIWTDVSLLNGVKAGWGLSYYSFESTKYFRQIETWYLGDEKALAAYELLNNHLQTLLGITTTLEVQEQDKFMRWEKDRYYVQLHLFEMHAFRCVLSIGLIDKK